MNKANLIFKYFQKKDLLKAGNKEYQKTLSSLFTFLIESDKVNEDKTGKLFPDKTITAKVLACEKGIAAGIEELCFLIKNFTSLTFRPVIKDGEGFAKDNIIAEIKGNSRQILAFERTILNILQRMSGIATQTNYLVNLISSNLKPTTLKPIHIAATRKTPWMWLDKKAVAVGGGLTHRLNLSDSILIKDNHLALRKKISLPHRNTLVEIEVETRQQAIQATKAFRPHAIMLDNFRPEEAKQTIEDLKNKFDIPDIIFEASGGIDENNIKDWVKTGVDIISLGALTHSVRASDFSLEIYKG